MIKLIGVLCATGSIFFDLSSYWKQISKTLRTKRSSQVSSTAYMMKLGHYLCSLVALTLFANWVGWIMEFAALVACLICFTLVIKYKPRNWRLFHFGK